MIQVLEKDFLNDPFIKTDKCKSIAINKRLNFNTKDIYYFGNYQQDKLDKVFKKINNNKKLIKNAIENKAKIIICGNSYELFNNRFNVKDSINLFTAFNNNNFTKRRFSKFMKIREKNDDTLEKISSLNYVVQNENFKYKNLYCVKSQESVKIAIKRLKKTK